MAQKDGDNDFDSKATYGFSTKGRERYADEMREYGYVALERYMGSEPDDPVERAYCCANCTSFRVKKESPTGYWCVKFAFPDDRNGCCDGWAPKKGGR